MPIDVKKEDGSIEIKWDLNYNPIARLASIAIGICIAAAVVCLVWLYR